MTAELLQHMAPVLTALEPLGKLRKKAAEYGDIVPLRVATALTNHLQLVVNSGNSTRRFEVAAAEPYAWREGGSGADWDKSYEALRKALIEKQERGCFFTRQYWNNFTLNIAILSEDDKSLTQVLLGAARVV